MNSETEDIKVVPKASRSAIWSLVLGLLSFVCWILAGIPAIVLGIIALGKIDRSQGQLTGRGMAIAGIATGAISAVVVVPLMLMIALLLPAVHAARGAAQRSQSMNHMKQVLLAMHMHESTQKTFPPARDGAGLSWRVRILPYLDHQNLYEQFHLDEPWDSEHNRQLISQMPEVFKDVQAELPLGKTNYLLVVGPNTPFGIHRAGPTIRQFIDGLSRTMILVEADPDQAVEWTKPDDWAFDEKNPMKGIGHTQPDGFIGGFADGSVSFFRRDTTPQEINELATYDEPQEVHAVESKEQP